MVRTSRTGHARLEKLKQEAVVLAKILRRQARRPFVLEITGTPKAGKTTLITLVDGFLRDAGWRVHVLTERASTCPLPMKGHFLFNTWTMGTMLAGLIDAVDRDDDLVILDRGVFDALIRLETQKRQGPGAKQLRRGQFLGRPCQLPEWSQRLRTPCRPPR